MDQIALLVAPKAENRPKARSIWNILSGNDKTFEVSFIDIEEGLVFKVTHNFHRIRFYLSENSLFLFSRTHSI